MNKFWQKVHLAFTDRRLRWQILFVAMVFILFRLGSAVPIPGVNSAVLSQFLESNQFFGLLNIFSGGGLSNLSIVMLGVGPFITASIIMQLLTIMVPALKELYHESGEAGRRKFAQYSRLITVPLAMLQGFSLLILLERQGALLPLSLFDRLSNVLVVAAGSIVLMWLGELISEYGIGNGVSLLIFGGILARLPSQINQALVNFEPSQLPIYLAFIIVAIITIAGVVIVTEAERPVPITYAKQVRGAKVYGGVSTYLPLRLNQSGVMPIIFALSILLFPQMIAQFLTNVSNDLIRAIASFTLDLLNNQWLYGSLYFLFIFLFTYFYSAITFDPEAIANNLQKSGAFIPGVRPGVPTRDHLNKTVNHLTLVGALFLGVVALLPLVMRAVTGLTSLAIGGTALLIVVSVALDLMKQIDAQLSMREY